MKEVAKLALDTLKLIASQDQGCGGTYTEAEAWRSAKYIALAGIASITKAMAQSEQKLVVCPHCHDGEDVPEGETCNECGFTHLPYGCAVAPQGKPLTDKQRIDWLCEEAEYTCGQWQIVIESDDKSFVDAIDKFVISVGGVRDAMD